MHFANLAEVMKNLSRRAAIWFLLSCLCLGGCLRQADRVPTEEPVRATTLYTFDLAQAVSGYDLNDPDQRRLYYDSIFLAVSLQGIVNREAPRLYFKFFDVDRFWRETIDAESNWLRGRPEETIETLDELLCTFGGEVGGWVIYDERVPATSAVAATLAGVEDLLVLRHDSMPHSLHVRFTGVDAPVDLPVRRWLLEPDGEPLFTGAGSIPGTDLTSTGSAKNDVYRWLIESFLKPGKINPLHFGYYLDAYWLENWDRADPESHTLTNLDFIIAQQGVIFDLHFEADEAPVDDPKQAPGTDFETILEMLAVANELTGGEAMIGMHGFVPWSFKYTNHLGAGGGKGAVHLEWRKSQVASAYNAFVDADALSYPGMANASFFQHFPLPEHIPQVALEPTEERLIEAGVLNRDGSLKPVIYYSHYAGDYDATAWVYRKMPEIWTDPMRGALPLTWPINPNLAQRFPFGLLWLRQTATEKDVFVAGDSGAGYVNPHQLSEPREFSGLSSGVPLWERWNTRWYRQWDLDATGFVVDGHTPFMTEDALAAYARFSPAGLGTQLKPPQAIFEGMPMLRIQTYFKPADASGFLNAAVEQMQRDFVNTSARPAFLTFRSVLWKPEHFVQLEERIDRRCEVPRILVDQRTLLWLYQHHQANP